MRRQLVARLVQSLIVVAIVTTISFIVIRSAPGDPFSYDGRNLTPANREHLRELFGYDKPIPVQFIRYVTNVAHGELGWSFTKRESVATALAETLPRTLLLTGIALGLSFVLGVIVGVLQATKRGRWFDRVSSSVLLLFYSVPDFWAALMILLMFAYWWPVLPAGRIVDPMMFDYWGPWGRLVDRVRHLILPVASLTLVSIAAIARYQRSAMLETLPADFIRTARAKGLPESQVIWRHALRTAFTPMITLLGLMLPAFLGGALFIEKVFAWPGMGLLAADAIGSRDYDVVTATVIVGSVMVVIGNLLADLLQLAIDPRIRD